MQFGSFTNASRHPPISPERMRISNKNWLTGGGPLGWSPMAALILGIVVVLLFVVFFVRRRKGQPREAPPPEVTRYLSDLLSSGLDDNWTATRQRPTSSSERRFTLERNVKSWGLAR